MKKKAFTLIELLIVIAIIGILASVVIVNLNNGRTKARDARRKTDLGSIQTALEIFYDSSNYYPVSTTSWAADCWYPQASWIFHTTTSGRDFSWSTPYMSAQPHDPIDTCLWPYGGQGAANDNNPTATYAYGSDTGQRYFIAARLEIASDPSTIQNAGTTGWSNELLYPDSWPTGRAYAVIKR